MKYRSPLPSMRWICVCVGLVLLSCAGAQPKGRTTESEEPSSFEVYEKGANFHRVQDYLEAEKFLLQSKEMNEKNGKRNGPTIWTFLGDTYRMMGRYAEAEEAYENKLAAIVFNHERKIAHERYKRGRYQDERQQLDLLLANEKIAHHIRRVGRLVEQERLDEAQKVFDETYALIEHFFAMPRSRPGQIITADYRKTVPGSTRAPIRAARGEYAGATLGWETQLRERIVLNGGGPQSNLSAYVVSVGRGKSLERKHESAMDIFGRLIEEGEKGRVTKRGLAAAHQGAGRIEERLGHIETAHNHFRDGAMVLQELDDARKPGSKARRYAVELADVLHRYAAFLLRQGRLPEARDQFDRSVDYRLQTQGPLHPFYGASLIGLAELEAREGNLDEALSQARRAQEIYEKALAPNAPRKARLYALLAVLEALGGAEPIESIPEFNRLGEVIQRPVGLHYENDALALERFARLLDSAGKTDAAATFRARAAQMHESPK